MSQASDGGERQIFEAALKRSRDHRETYVRSACADSPALAQRILRLLEAHHQAEDTPTERLAAEPVDGIEAAGSQPERIGPYRILQRIGEGGMGVVFVAEQVEPVRRKVAIKLIKAGMDTREVIARFHSERQALALMNHPNIARILEAGATDGGRPYFVMEYVPGMPLLDYCDLQRLGIKQRLHLFIDICDAVQHAHHKGVIHRDLKPSNILIHEEDGKPTPKVIDFGVAKAVAQQLSDLTVHTRVGGFIGTPEYASPEQARVTGLDVDTRADVYSLGAVLYELLTGARPFDFSGPGFGFAKIQAAIFDQEPPPPSRRVSTDGESSRASATGRGTDPVTLARTLRHDLDWIVAKALEKDRNRRYASASELAADVERYLDGAAVTAGPRSASYRLRRFARRHKPVLVLGGLVLLALISGVVGTTLGLLRARQEAAKARVQTVIAQEINTFLNDDLLAAVAPSRLGIDVSMRQVLDQAAARIEGRFADQPLVEASLRQTIGETYRHLGVYAAAEPHLKRAVELRTEVQGAEHPESLLAVFELGTLYRRQARFDQAEPLISQVLADQRRLLGDREPPTLATMGGLAMLYQATERYNQAEALYLESMAAWEQRLGPQHPKALAVAEDLATLYRYLDRFEEAESLLENALEGQRKTFGPEHSVTLNSVMNLAAIYMGRQRYGDAEPLLLNNMEPMRRVMGPEHPRTLMMAYNLGYLYYRQQRFDEAEPLLIENLAMKGQILGLDHPGTHKAENALMALYRDSGAEDKLAPLASAYQNRLRRKAKTPGATARDKNAYAWNLLTAQPSRLQDPELALRIALEANSMGNFSNPIILDTLAHAYYRTGDTAHAIATSRKALAAADDQPPAIRRAIEKTLADFSEG